jgi:hypothetical protein
VARITQSIKGGIDMWTAVIIAIGAVWYLIDTGISAYVKTHTAKTADEAPSTDTD